MSKLIFILCLSIVLINCDGRDRVFKTTEEALIENKLLDSFSESIQYFPELYREVETDTTLSNGYKVKIRYYSDMKNQVTEKTKEDLISNIKHYRDFVSEVTVLKDSKEIFKKSINKYNIREGDTDFVKIVQKLILQPIFVNQEKSIENNNLIIALPLCSTDTSHCLFYELIINADGKFEYRLMEGNNNFYH